MTQASLAIDGAAERLFAELFSVPLYQPEHFAIDESTAEATALALRTRPHRLDAYCPGCGKTTTWKVTGSLEAHERRARVEAALSAPASLTGAVRSAGRASYLSDFELTAVCSREIRHEVRLMFSVSAPSRVDLALHVMNGTKNSEPWTVTKIGQYPSLTDFQIGDLKQYEDGLSKAQRREFVRAINSAAHGFNVAACVYYRRVFESILMEARDEHMARLGMTDWPEFRDARGMDERIRLLRDELPRFMSEHPQLYGVLSIGVHELTEEQCGGELPMLRKAIELIVNDRVAAARAAKDREALAKLLAQSVDRHKK